MILPLQQGAIRNELLRSLSAANFALLQPDLERDSYEQGAVMEAPGVAISHIYFPEPGMISVVAQTKSGVRVEAGVIGPEGMTGLAVLEGVDRSPHATFVQIPCRAVRLEIAVFKRSIEASRSLHAHLHLYAQTFSVQLANTVLCNGHFTIDQRLARWILMAHDRADREDLSLMPSVRRAGVTNPWPRLRGRARSRRAVAASAFATGRGSLSRPVKAMAPRKPSTRGS